MVTLETRRDFLKKAKKLAVVAALGGTGYVAYKYMSVTKQQVEFGPVVDDLRMSGQQLSDYLGIRPERPTLAMTREAWGGWAGPSMYVFRRVNITTPYLEKEQQLNNWNYVLFRERRIEPLTNELCAVSPEIKRAVDHRYRSILRR